MMWTVKGVDLDGESISESISEAYTGSLPEFCYPRPLKSDYHGFAFIWWSILGFITGVLFMIITYYGVIN